MIGKLYSVVLDTPDHHGLAAFYAALTGGEVTGVEHDWADVVTPDGWRLSFQLAPDHVPPRWPDPTAPQQMHLDLRFPDIEAARARAESLGARKIGGDSWHVMADPSGHPFCVSTFAQADPSQVFAVSIDTREPGRLARFYAGILGASVTYEGEEGSMIGGGGPMSTVVLQKVPVHQPPRWPEPAAPQQLHLDIEVDDIPAADPLVIALGAARLGESDAEGFRVYADPAGHPFCLVAHE